MISLGVTRPGGQRPRTLRGFRSLVDLGAEVGTLCWRGDGGAHRQPVRLKAGRGPYRPGWLEVLLGFVRRCDGQPRPCQAGAATTVLEGHRHTHHVVPATLGRALVSRLADQERGLGKATGTLRRGTAPGLQRQVPLGLHPPRQLLRLT